MRASPVLSLQQRLKLLLAFLRTLYVRERWMNLYPDDDLRLLMDGSVYTEGVHARFWKSRAMAGCITDHNLPCVH